MSEDRLIAAAEIGKALGLSRARGYQLSHTDGFPKPKKYTGLEEDRPHWSLKAVLAWQRKQKRKEAHEGTNRGHRRRASSTG